MWLQTVLEAERQVAISEHKLRKQIKTHNEKFPSHLTDNFVSKTQTQTNSTTNTNKNDGASSNDGYVCANMCVCMYVCMYVYIYI